MGGQKRPLPTEEFVNQKVGGHWFRLMWNPSMLQI